MTHFIFPPAAIGAAIVGSDFQFPVRRVFCIGRNYAAHAREMGADPTKEAPVFFMKPADAVVGVGEAVAFPSDTENLHHEVELVVALGQGGWDVRAEEAANLVFGYAIGIDLTKRDRQAEAKAAGAPWERSKSFEASAPMGPIHRVEDVGHLVKGAITLSVNGALKQKGDLSDLIWNVPAIIAKLSEYWTLQAGDLIFTGTPEGVGPLQRGDKVRAEIEGLAGLELEMGR
jgi:fumarylpyruvate hydrolase